jgi:hypothetical protein
MKHLQWPEAPFDGLRPGTLSGVRRDRRPMGLGTSEFLVPYIVLVIIAFAANWPGRANPDTIDMLWQARELSGLNDWHAPFITLIYGLLSPLLGSPGGALMLQVTTLMLWPSFIFAQIARARIGTISRGIAFCLWCVICAVLVALSGQIVKDMLLVCFASVLLLLLSTVGFAAEADSSSPFFRKLGIASLLMAISLIRLPNLLVIDFSLLVAALASQRRRQRFLVLAFIAGVGLPAITVIFSRHIVPAHHGHPERALQVFDLAGMSTSLKRDLFEDLAGGKPMPAKRPWECYTPKQSDAFLWGACQDYARFLADHSDRVTAFWLEQIARHPGAYLTHRLRFTSWLLSRDGAANEVIVPPPPQYWLATNNAQFIKDLPERMAVRLQLWQPTIAYVPFGTIAHLWFQSPLGDPLVWVTILAIGVWGGSRRLQLSNDALPLLVSVAGLGNVLLFMAFGASDDFRYLLPTMLCAIATVVLSVERGLLSTLALKRFALRWPIGNSALSLR